MDTDASLSLRRIGILIGGGKIMVVTGGGGKTKGEELDQDQETVTAVIPKDQGLHLNTPNRVTLIHLLTRPHLLKTHRIFQTNSATFTRTQKSKTNPKQMKRKTPRRKCLALSHPAFLTSSTAT